VRLSKDDLEMIAKVRKG
jgi:ribosome biogenesis protein ERB1